ncbi:hypothetical protein [Miniphocaeibacter massiliensis]|uniref:hypothetical protein n=1 Tax=Miniphocaeibacter massiliensis TaxID=2041841 RepID=UPI000C1C0FAE|nr:hypothetical protein [Miniphocaeibacter massiliensis]
MKKKLLILGLIMVMAFTACGDNKSKDEDPTKVAENKKEDGKKTSKKELKAGETWEVEGQWKVTVDSVTVTKERNEYSDKKPEEVVIVKYTYENLGYESDIQDLFITPSGVIDGKGEMGEIYPANISVYPKPTPVGAKTVDAEEAFGINNASDTVKVIFEIYDVNSTQHKATFECPVTK